MSTLLAGRQPTEPLSPEIATKESLADLLERLGGISAARVRAWSASGSATVEDVVAIRDQEGRLVELVDGVLVEKAMGLRESLLAVAIAGWIRDFVKPRKLGIVIGADGTMQLVSKLVRIPDAAFLSWNRFPGGRIPSEPVPLAAAPDLAVEVFSEGNTHAEMNQTLAEFFAAGTLLVWIVYPIPRTVAVYTSTLGCVILDESATLDGGAVLPGFSLPVRQIFTELDEVAPSSA